MQLMKSYIFALLAIIHCTNALNRTDCQYYKDEVFNNITSNGLEILNQTVEIQYDIKLSGNCQSSRCAIFRIGDEGDFRFPSLSIGNNTDIYIEMNHDPNNWDSYHISNSPNLLDGKYHNIYLYISSHVFVFRVDDNLYHYDYKNEPRNLSNNMTFPLRIYDYINTTISNICIKTSYHNLSPHGGIKCGDTITGEFTSSLNISYYYFQLSLVRYYSYVISLNLCSYKIYFNNDMGYDAYLYSTGIFEPCSVEIDIIDSKTLSYLLLGERILAIHALNHGDNTYQLQMECERIPINCGDRISGELTTRSQIDYYSFKLPETQSIVFDSCGSSYNTHLYLMDKNEETILFEAEDEGTCNDKAQLFISLLPPGQYVLAISGYGDVLDHDHGAWQMQIDCYQDFTNYNASYIMILQDSVKTWLDGQLECQQLFGTSLATIVTNTDLLEAKHIAIVAVYIGLYKDGFTAK